MKRTKKDSPESGTESTGTSWGVKMITPTRYVRFHLKEDEGDDLSPAGRALWERVARGAGYETVPEFPIGTEEERTRRLLTTRRIAGATLILLFLLAGALAYNIWLRPAGVITDLNALTRQINETEAHLARLDRELLGLSIENNALRQKNEAIGAELTRARELLHARKIRQQQRSPGQGRPSAIDQVGPGDVPLATPPFPLPAGPQGEQRPLLDVVETPSSKVYSIH